MHIEGISEGARSCAGSASNRRDLEIRVRKVRVPRKEQPPARIRTVVNPWDLRSSWLRLNGSG